MNFSSLLQWWEEWQLRVLVLGSLVLQFLLAVTSRVRSGRPSFLFRSSVWLAYLASDALAIYALATLFNRHKLPKGDVNDTSDDLEMLWAPVLLIHLGGQHPMTAYSIEDNELWKRQIVTLVSQVTVAIYVFCKSWPRGDGMLLQAAILLFIIGVLKFCQKPVALKRASIASLTNSWAVCPPRQAHGGTKLGKLTEWFFTDLVTISSLRDRGATQNHQEDDLSLKDYVEEAKKLVSPTKEEERDDDELYEPNFMRSISLLFVDQSAPYARRLGILQYFLKAHRKGRAYQYLMADIGISFKLFYTNLKGTLSFPGLLLKLLLTFLTIPPIMLFAKTHKQSYHKTDIVVTYILLCSTCLLEILWLFFFRVSRRWPNTIAQHNIISFCAHKSSSKLMKLASQICTYEFEAYISKHRYTGQESESKCIDITNLVVDHVRDGWMQYIHDSASYKRFNSLRGQWTMTRHKSCLHLQLRLRLRWTLRLPFDESVLVWHLATELCLHHPRSSPGVAQDNDPCGLSSIISNYMIYLLFVRPEMLAPGTRQGLFMTACDDISLLMLRHADNHPSWDQGSIARWILRIAKFPWANPENKVTLVLKACQLAEQLMEVLPNEDERWKVIQGAWVEILCFSASRCRGYLHAKSMGNGVEFLTYVWFLLSYMGMETFADKFQMPDLEVVQEEEEEAAAAAATSQLHVSHEEEEIV